MLDLQVLVISSVAGVLIGLVFFGGLWWTVRRSLASAHPAAWVLGSVLLRTAVALAGFYVVGASQWPRLLACLAGFVVGRFILTHWTRMRAPGNALPVGD